MKLGKEIYWLGSCIVVIYFLTAIHSSGYYHPDEHFQIIEFAGLKTGWNQAADLPWEYDEQIRSTLQPALAVEIFNMLESIRIHDPYIKVLCLRMITAFFALSAISFFVYSFRSTIKPINYLAFVCLSFLLWFIPVVNVRFSSETWSGLFLLLAVAWINKEKVPGLFSYMGVGFLLGIAFEFRFQLAICIVGIFLWFCFIKKWDRRELFCFIFGLFAAIILGTGIDYWYYGDFVCTPYNYFKANIINDVASNFGVAPWYYYFYSIINHATLLIGLAILGALIVALIKNPKSVVVWCLFPFLVIHCLIPHKELRFLFPLINFIPILLLWFYQWIKERVNNSSFEKMVLYPLIGVMLFINVGGLIMEMFKPAGNGNVGMTNYIREKYKDKGATVYTLPGYDIYAAGTVKGLIMRFYLDENIHRSNFFKSRKEVATQLKDMKDTDLILLPSYQNFYAPLIFTAGFHQQKQSIPEWILKLNKLYNTYNESATWILYTKNMSK